MKRYCVTLSSYAYYTVYIEADSKESAEKEAQEYCNDLDALTPYDSGAYVVEGETYEVANI